MQGSVSNNETIKISTAVNAQRTSSGTIYTCAANSYAILNVYITAGADYVSIGGFKILQGSAGGTYTLYVGPSQSVVTNHSASDAVNVSGVEFINSP